MAAATDAEIKMNNDMFIDSFLTDGQEKRAMNAVDDYTRTEVYEDGLARKILPFKPINNEDLVRQVHTDAPYTVIDKQPGSPAAVTVSFGNLPENVYMEAPRYPVGFATVQTKRHRKDINRLRTWKMDIRQVFSDMAARRILIEEDTKFFRGVNRGLGGAKNATNPWSGAVQWKGIPGAIDRRNVTNGQKIMTTTGDNALHPSVAVINHTSIFDLVAMDRAEAGGDISQDMLMKGWTYEEMFGIKWHVTIKRTLVPDDTIFFFATEEYLGKAFELQPPTMYMKKEAFMLEFYQYETIGSALGHTGGLARADYE